MGMSWGGMGKREEGILLRASSERVESVTWRLHALSLQMPCATGMVVCGYGKVPLLVWWK
jgi:hypothetical protein